MKKILVLLSIVAGTHISAQSFQKNQFDINFGVGIGNTFVGSGATKVIPSISTAVEYGVTDAISAGVYLGYAGASYQYSGVDWCPSGNGIGNAFGNYYNYTDTYKWRFSIAGIRGAYHFAKLIPADKLDVYAGLMIGANFSKYTFSSDNPCPGHVPVAARNFGKLIWSGYAGARYRFVENFGAFAELGYGISYLTLGVNISVK